MKLIITTSVFELSKVELPDEQLILSVHKTHNKYNEIVFLLYTWTAPIDEENVKELVITTFAKHNIIIRSNSNFNWKFRFILDKESISYFNLRFVNPMILEVINETNTHRT